MPPPTLLGRAPRRRLLGALLCAALAGVSSHEHRDVNGSLPFSCGTHSPHEEHEMRRLQTPPHHREAVHAIYLRGRERRSLQSSADAVITLPTMIYHVVRSSNGAGALTNAQLTLQHEALMSAFHPYIRFGAWERRDYIDNDVYSQGCSDSTLMRTFQAQNAEVDKLNSYFVNCISSSLFGYAYLPYSFAENSPFHGAVLDSNSIDGTVCQGGCQGDTGVHEWGHAFGLLHTFESQLVAGDRENGCDCTWGDLVDDTPPEAEPAYGGASNCAAHALSDTCTDDNENDPVSNYMDYSDDVCLSHFTDGQFYRMLYILALEKPNLLSISLGNGVDGECFPGTHREGDQCVVCPEGTYQDDFGQTECKLCPNGAQDVLITGNGDELGEELLTHENQCYHTGVADNCIDRYLGDGWCDAANNNEECRYDLGDCCEDCCNSNAPLNCGTGDPGHELFVRCLDSSCSSSQSAVPFDYILLGAGECARFVFGGNFSDSAVDDDITGQVDAVISLNGPSFEDDEADQEGEFLAALLQGIGDLLELNSTEVSITGSLTQVAQLRTGSSSVEWSLNAQIVIPYSYLVDNNLANDTSDPSLTMSLYVASLAGSLEQGVEDGSYEAEVEETIANRLDTASTYAGFTSAADASTAIVVSPEVTVDSGLVLSAPDSSASLVASPIPWLLWPATMAVLVLSRMAIDS